MADLPQPPKASTLHYATPEERERESHRQSRKEPSSTRPTAMGGVTLFVVVLALVGVICYYIANARP